MKAKIFGEVLQRREQQHLRGGNAPSGSGGAIRWKCRTPSGVVYYTCVSIGLEAACGVTGCEHAGFCNNPVVCDL